ncbi:MAG: hypothetical protein OEY52_06425 [Gammaproteobacteria bacterium]|nr:hypothetical protein [Gammaproteobacteria bacterium]
MKRTVFSSIVTTLLLAITSQASTASEADYQIEFGFGLFETDYTSPAGNTAELSGSIIAFEYFLDTVNVRNQPLAEAWFMNRIGSFGVAFGEADYDQKDRSGEIDLNVLGFTYMQPGSPLYLDFYYTTGSEEYDFKPGYSFIDYSNDLTSTSVTLGYFVKQNTLFVFEYESAKYEHSPAAYSQFDYTRKETNLKVKHLAPSGNGTMLNIIGLVGKTTYDEKTKADTDNTVMGFEVDFYPNSTTSIGGTFEQTTGDDNGYKGKKVGLQGKLFLTPKFSIAVEFSEFSGKGTSSDKDAINLTANIRM